MRKACEALGIALCANNYTVVSACGTQSTTRTDTRRLEFWRWLDYEGILDAFTKFIVRFSY
jgi:hypothetical protein